MGYLVDDGPVAGRRDGFAGLAGRFEPGLLGLGNFSQGLLRGGSEGRARIQVGDIGDIAAVFVAVKDVDMVVGASGVLQLNIIFFYEAKELPNLVRFGFTGDLLKVDQLRDVGMSKDVVATPGALENETKALGQTEHIRKRDIPKITLRKFLEELLAIHQFALGISWPCCR